MPKTSMLYQRQDKDFTTLVKKNIAGSKNVSQLAVLVGVSPPTMYSHIDHPERLTVGELRKVIKVAGITPEQATALLF